MDRFINRAKVLMARLDAFASQLPNNIAEEHDSLAISIFLKDSVTDYRDCVLEAQSILYASGQTHLYQESIKTDNPSPRLLYRLLELAVEYDPRHRQEHD